MAVAGGWPGYADSHDLRGSRREIYRPEDGVVFETSLLQARFPSLCLRARTLHLPPFQLNPIIFHKEIYEIYFQDIEMAYCHFCGKLGACGGGLPLCAGEGDSADGDPGHTSGRHREAEGDPTPLEA